MSGRSDIPGPLGLLLRAHSDPLGTLDTLASGDDELMRVARLPMSGRALFLAFGERHLRHILLDNGANYTKGLSYRVFTDLFGYGLINSDGELWRRQHRAVQSSFSGRCLRAYLPTMSEVTDRRLGAWDGRDGEVVDVHHEMNTLALDVVGRTLFGFDLQAQHDRIAPALATLFETLMSRVYSPLTWLAPRAQNALPTPSQRRYREAFGAMSELAGEIVAAHEREPRAGDLVDDVVQHARSAAARPEDLVSELIVFLIAAHETSANVLAFAIALLAAHPETRAAVESEVDAAAPDATELPWVSAVLRETMRLYPPAWYVERRTRETDVLDGREIPAGSTVALPPYMVHRNPRLWERAHEFVPDRFLGTTSNAFGMAFVPFGAGERRCVGQQFAMNEMTVALAAVTRSWRLEPTTPVPPPAEAVVTLRPRGGLPMRLVRRPRQTVGDHRESGEEVAGG